jgi:predicted HicB family RNase H-like nuclease
MKVKEPNKKPVNVNVEFDGDLHQRMKIKAAIEGKSLKDWLIMAAKKMANGQ